jgi:4-hydroxybenzoate polyprenyltransferase
MNTLAVEQYSILSLRFLKAYVITMRPYLMFVSGITTIVGISFSPEIGTIKILLLFFAGFLSYGFGQALTDCFQIDTDSISSPYRPLTQGLVNRNYFLIISSLGLLVCISIFTYFNPLNLFLGILAGIGLTTYTNFKRKWWGGPFYNAWIVLVLFLMSYLAGVGSFTFDEANLIFVVSVIVVFFGYANFVLTGYFKDIFADKSTGYLTLPVQFGRKTSALVSDVFGTIASTAVLVLIVTLAFDSFPFQTLITSLVFIYTGIGMAVLTQISLHSVKSDNEAYIAISPCVHSYLLLISGLALLNKQEWFIPLIVFYIFYLITLKIRPAKNQI